ncbi:MAG: energy transducer TonB [Gammaproteobacteria bacterium]|nr:MAG: energy transducer TonB [Gammaproteobacteria bacterium]
MGTAKQTATAGPGWQPIEWSAAAARDRLSSTLFLAALFHAIVILGVGFGAPPGFTPATSLDVVIVNRQDSPALPPAQATALAERNLAGAGNTRESAQLRTAITRRADAEAFGPERTGADTARLAGEERHRQAELVTSLTGERPAPLAVQAGERRSQPQRTALPGVDRAVELVNEPDSETLITASGPRELVVSASTRESRIARYLSGWKRKVERIGTLNFPRQAASRGLHGNPTLEVAIGADGRLREVLVRRSSGTRQLDDAAIEILRLAAPFEPFPAFLRNDYDVLRFAYEWRFGDRPGAGTLTMVHEG